MVANAGTLSAGPREGVSENINYAGNQAIRAQIYPMQTRTEAHKYQYENFKLDFTLLRSRP